MDRSINDKIDSFFSDYRLRSYKKGQILLLSGDTVEYVYQLVAGNVKQYDVSPHGDEVILNIFKSPAFFPMSQAINRTKNQHIYEAETDIKIRQAPADKTVEFIKNNPDVTFDLLSRVYRGIDGVLGRVTQLMTGTARSRLLFEIIVEAKRFGKKQDNGYLLELHEKDLGARAGLSRETVSREIHKLKRANLLQSTKQGLVIEDLSKLEAILAEES